MSLNRINTAAITGLFYAIMALRWKVGMVITTTLPTSALVKIVPSRKVVVATGIVNH
jgi:hypothetical protein